jgi:hypothetical protein
MDLLGGGAGVRGEPELPVGSAQGTAPGGRETPALSPNHPSEQLRICGQTYEVDVNPIRARAIDECGEGHQPSLRILADVRGEPRLGEHLS